MRDKLDQKGLDHCLTMWLLDYLTNEPQIVRTGDSVSNTGVYSTEALQGTVLAFFLFNLYTADFSHHTANCHLQNKGPSHST